MKTLIEKELKSIILSPKFVATFSVCSILILLSIFVGIQEYQAAVRQYEAANELLVQQLREQSSFMGLSTRVYREPDPMQIFVSGVNYDLGRLSNINSFNSVKLTNSVYSDDPIFAAFRFIDFTFIVQIVLSLFAILFTYDAINGEREDGTLKLIFSNAVPRTQYILSKFLGSWLGLGIPLLIPVMLGLLLLMVFKVPVTETHWTKITILLASSLLYFTFFIAFGILVSALTHRSTVSFLFCLVVWVTFVLIVPRAGVMAAGQMISVPSVAEIEGQQDGFQKARWKQYTDKLEERWRSRNLDMEAMDAGDRDAYREEHLWSWMEEDDAERKDVQQDIDAFSRKLTEELRNRKAEQKRLAFTFSRLSPASAYQLTAVDLAGTNIDLKTRYEDAMQQYRSDFTEYREKKQKESGGHGGIRISIDSDTGFKMSTGRDKGTLDFSDMPRFETPKHALSDAIVPTITGMGLLSLYSLAAFAGAFVVFLRYDVR